MNGTWADVEDGHTWPDPADVHGTALEEASW